MLAAFSFLAAPRLAGRFGLVNTMVFTHIPSSLCLIARGGRPTSTSRWCCCWSCARAVADGRADPHLLRDGGGDAGGTPAAAASVTAVPRSLASAVSPALAGLLLGTPFSGLPLVFCGALKIVYDVALLVSFRHIKPPEERERK